MNRALIIIAFSLLALAGSLRAAEIVLIYPRVPVGQTEFSYPVSLDTSFALGHVTPVSAQLFINDTPVKLTADGAFLTRLPLQKSGDHGAWDLRLKDNGQEVASLSFPFHVGIPTAATADTLPALNFPCVVRVTQPHAHIRTERGGSYYIFPDVDCPLLATARESGFYRVQIGDNFGYIETASVTASPDSTLAPVIIGNAICSRTPVASVCQFALPRTVLWQATVSDDGKTMDLVLYGVRCGIERIRYDASDQFIREIRWQQNASNTVLHFASRRKIRNGFDIAFDQGLLTVTLRNSQARDSWELKGKTVVIDPGHGGSSFGAVGALGTREKDVNLKLAQLLADELEKRGAHALLTREIDDDPGLYERMNFAQQQHADFFISLHCNALPDSENPFIRHGSGTYYYQSFSRTAAEILHRHLLKATGLRDDGLYYADLAAVRPVAFPAVLVETAYLIDPTEEKLLLSDQFLHKISNELTRGLKEYFQSEP